MIDFTQNKIDVIEHIYLFSTSFPDILYRCPKIKTRSINKSRYTIHLISDNSIIVIKPYLGKVRYNKWRKR